MATKSKKPITPLVTYDADREEKRKALKTAMKQIEKDGLVQVEMDEQRTMLIKLL